MATTKTNNEVNEVEDVKMEPVNFEEEYNKVRADYNALIEQYNRVVNKYRSLLDIYGELLDKYTNIEKNQ